MFVKLNTTKVTFWMVFIHGNNYPAGDYSSTFGGAYFSVPTEWNSKDRVKKLISFAFSLKIFNRIEDKDYVCKDRPDYENFDMNHCLSEFYAKNIGCSSPWESHIIPEFPLCKTDIQYRGKAITPITYN